MAYIPTNNAINKLRKTKSGSVAIDCQTVFKAVNEYFEINTNILLTKSRKREIVYPRQIAMYFLANYTVMSLKAIGVIFGKDHTTVIHSLEAVEGWMDTDEKVRQQIDQITRKILPYGLSGEEDIRGGA